MLYVCRSVFVLHVAIEYCMWGDWHSKKFKTEKIVRITDYHIKYMHVELEKKLFKYIIPLQLDSAWLTKSIIYQSMRNFLDSFEHF